MVDLVPVIGLEVHAQLKTRSKLFCSCRAASGEEPNRNVCPICLGHPGALPVVNRHAVELAVRAALAVGGSIRSVSAFVRKNYFYPDLPKNYQITQLDPPLSEGGAVDIGSAEAPRPVGIERTHLEEDAGKSRHLREGSAATTRIDLNRCGVPLIEIVTKPEIDSPKAARAFLSRLRRLLLWIDVCDGSMEAGSLRCDANISIHERRRSMLGTRTELKNLNSLRFLEQALAYEIERQSARIEQGKPIVRETRRWDEAARRTTKLRGKEEGEDYRYFREPDLPSLIVSDAWLGKVAAEMPELPDLRCKRFVVQFGLSEEEAVRMTSQRSMADYFEALVEYGAGPKQAADWISTKLAVLLEEGGLRIDRSPVTPASLASLLTDLGKGRISARQAKELLASAVREGQELSEILVAQEIRQIEDPTRLARWIEECLVAHPDEVMRYLAGKTGILNYLAGQVQARSGGRANPIRVMQMLREHLERRRKG